MLNVYFWNGRYKKVQDILIVGAETEEEAKNIIEDNLRQYDFNGGIEEILSKECQKTPTSRNEVSRWGMNGEATFRSLIFLLFRFSKNDKINNKRR